MNQPFKSLKELFETPERTEYVTAPEVKDSVDWDQIHKLEGGSQNKGYVPNSGRSGVTVGAGFDIGQHPDIEKLDISPELRDKIAPFAGIERDNASDILEAKGGLVLSPEEASQLNEHGKNETLGKLKEYWAKHSDVPFESLTPAQQTVLASVAYQYGTIGRTPRFAQHATTGNWEGAVKELRNFGDKYKSRRNREADLLEQSLGQYRTLAENKKY